MADYIKRHIDWALNDRLGASPALLLTGPHGCGKTTTASARVTSVINLDDAAQADTFASRPGDFITTVERPVLIDEWQQVPTALAAVARAIDHNRAARQFIVAGARRSRYLPDPAPLDLTPLRLWPLTQAELTHRPKLGLDWLWQPTGLRPAITGDAPNILGYLALATAGGLPEAVRLGAQDRRAWFDTYVRRLIHHDVEPLADVREPAKLAALLATVAANAGQAVPLGRLARLAGLARPTAVTYLNALVDTGIVQRVLPWRPASAQQGDQYYVTDSGLAAALTGADTPAVTSDPTVLTALINTFVMAQLHPMADLAGIAMTHHGAALILQRAEQVVALTVQPSATPPRALAAELTDLRQTIGRTMAAGYVLHCGPDAFRLGEGLWALPIAALWRPELALVGDVVPVIIRQQRLFATVVGVQ